MPQCQEMSIFPPLFFIFLEGGIYLFFSCVGRGCRGLLILYLSEVQICFASVEVPFVVVVIELGRGPFIKMYTIKRFIFYMHLKLDKECHE